MSSDALSLAGNDRTLVDLVMDHSGVNKLKQEVNDLHLSTLTADFGILKAQVNKGAGELAHAGALPLLLMQTTPALALGLMGLNGGAALLASTNVIGKALTLALHEHGFALLKPHIESVLTKMSDDQAVRDEWSVAIHKTAIDMGLLPAPAVEGAAKASAEAVDPLTRFMADGIVVLLQGRGLQAVVAPVVSSLQKMAAIATASAEKVATVAGRIWDKVTLVAKKASEAVAVAHEEMKAPASWGSWVPSAIRSRAASVLSSINEAADQVKSHVEAFTSSLSTMRSAFV